MAEIAKTRHSPELGEIAPTRIGVSQGSVESLKPPKEYVPRQSAIYIRLIPV